MHTQSSGQGRHMGLYQLLLFIVFGVIASKKQIQVVNMKEMNKAISGDTPGIKCNLLFY